MTTSDPRPPNCLHKDRPRSTLGMCRACYQRYHRVRAGITKRTRVPLPEPERVGHLYGGLDPAKILLVQPVKHFNEDVEPGTLTRRELAVLKALAMCDGQKAAAHSLGIAVNTLKNHLTRIHQKLGSYSLMGTYFRLGWLKVPDEPES